jgi:hypothetical protein
LGNVARAVLILDNLADPVGVVGAVGKHDRAFGQIVAEQLCNDFVMCEP